MRPQCLSNVYDFGVELYCEHLNADVNDWNINQNLRRQGRIKKTRSFASSRRRSGLRLSPLLSSPWKLRLSPQSDVPATSLCRKSQSPPATPLLCRHPGDSDTGGLYNLHQNDALDPHYWDGPLAINRNNGLPPLNGLWGASSQRPTPPSSRKKRRHQRCY